MTAAINSKESGNSEDGDTSRNSKDTETSGKLSNNEESALLPLQRWKRQKTFDVVLFRHAML